MVFFSNIRPYKGVLISIHGFNTTTPELSSLVLEMGYERVDATEVLDPKRALARLVHSSDEADARHTAKRRQEDIEYRQTPAHYVREHSSSMWWSVLKLVVAALLLLWFRSSMAEEQEIQRNAYDYLRANKDVEADDQAKWEMIDNARRTCRRDVILAAVGRMVTENIVVHRIRQYEGEFFIAITGAMQQDFVILVFGIATIAAITFLIITSFRTIFDKRVWSGEKIVE